MNMNIYREIFKYIIVLLTLSWRRPLSYRNQSIEMLCKPMDWFLYDNGLCQEKELKEINEKG